MKKKKKKALLLLVLAVGLSKLIDFILDEAQELINMMANNWKTKKEIMADYGYSEGTFYSRCKECSLLPDYRNAIIHDGGQRTYVDENRFQDFLRYRSEQYRKRMLDPHLKEDE